MDGPASGAWNMAVDEALLLESESPTLRLYRWEEPTLSLGYFQSASAIPAELAKARTVRRLSGGGAIVHDIELTYSIVFPAGRWPRENFIEMVRDVHGVIAGLAPGLKVAEKSSPGEEPFLCFERRSENDLVAGSYKIVGSAQRSKQGNLLQHGSILAKRSRWTPSLFGVEELLAGVTISDAFGERMAREVARRWGWELVAGDLSEKERARAVELEREKYLSASWTEKR